MEAPTPYRIYTVVPDGGGLGKLVAECDTFGEALAIATAAPDKSRAIVHLSRIVWPRSMRSDASGG